MLSHECSCYVGIELIGCYGDSKDKASKLPLEQDVTTAKLVDTDLEWSSSKWLPYAD